MPEENKEDREGGQGRERRGLEERGSALDCVFVIANKAVGWDIMVGITGSGLGSFWHPTGITFQARRGLAGVIQG